MNRWEKEVQKPLLDSEEAALKELEKQYAQALKEIQEKVKLFQVDIDLLDQALSQDGMDEATKAMLQSRKQSKIYQQQYQKALQQQIGSILNKMHGDNYTTIDKYLKDCYESGYIGTMYNIANQGIPIITPIDQSAVVKAVLTDSKVSNGLYNALGVNVDKLKKTITQEISRGIATGMGYADMARNISSVSKAPLSRTKTIARTEGHRIQEASTFDAAMTAKERGIDQVKQWDASLDGKTRDSHRQVDGEIKELDEKFSNGLMYPGDTNGGAAEVVNCRCTMLVRARAALDESELEELKQRAAYFGLDKAENFKEFEEKYLKAAKTLENSGKTVYNKGAISGAYNDENDPYGEKRDAHAERYYAALRNGKKSSVVEAIAANTGIDKTTVSNVFDHLFVNEYQLDGGLKRFDADYDIAQSIQRLRLGKGIQEHDLILLRHESMEYDLMHNEGLNYEQAHGKANELYNYALALKKFMLRKDGE